MHFGKTDKNDLKLYNIENLFILECQILECMRLIKEFNAAAIISSLHTRHIFASFKLFVVWSPFVRPVAIIKTKTRLPFLRRLLSVLGQTPKFPCSDVSHIAIEYRVRSQSMQFRHFLLKFNNMKTRACFCVFIAWCSLAASRYSDVIDEYFWSLK